MIRVVMVLAVSAASAWTAQLDVPFFRQQKNGCGAASVAMVAHYWSKPPATAPPATEVYRRLYAADRNGIPLADMKRYLEELGFRAFTLRGQASDLEAHLAKGRPVIVGLKPGRSKGLHFAVLAGTEGERVWLNDPTRKQPHWVKRDQFEKQWQLADRWMLLAAPKAD